MAYKRMNLSGPAIRNRVGWLNGSIMVGCLVHELGINHGHERFATRTADPELAIVGRLQVSVWDQPYQLGLKYTEIRSDPDSVHSKV